jgi:hypothetical protein
LGINTRNEPYQLSKVLNNNAKNRKNLGFWRIATQDPSVNSYLDADHFASGMVSDLEKVFRPGCVDRRESKKTGQFVRIRNRFLVINWPQ